MQATGAGAAGIRRPAHDGYRRSEGGKVEPAAVHEAIARVRAGDGQALRVLYVQYSDSVRRYATRLLGDRDMADDVTQTTFLKLLRILHRYERREAPFEAWLLRVARNVALDMARQRRGQVATGGVERQLEAVPASGRAADDRRALTEALAALPAAQREVIVLRHVLGLSTSEIAQRLGRSETAVNNLHHRARAALRVALRAADTTPSTTRLIAAVPTADQGHGGQATAQRTRVPRFERRGTRPSVVKITN